VELQLKRLFIGVGLYFHPHFKIGIKKRVNIYNKRKNEWQLINKMFIIEFLFLSFGMGVLLD
jgi:hypothetical protein